MESDHFEDDDGLFSTLATDNAEVVPPYVPPGADGLWSTDANSGNGAASRPRTSQRRGRSIEGDPDDTGDFGVGPSVPPAAVGATRRGSAEQKRTRRSGGDRRRTTRSWPGRRRSDDGSAGLLDPAAAGIFSAEPVARSDDVIESWDDGYADGDTTIPQGRGPGGPGSDPGSSGHTYDIRDTNDATPAVEDRHGLHRAVSRLADDAAERARVPIAACGALLRAGEVVLAVVTGRMLGRSAAVVLTDERVLVANDRRWQPLVDEFLLDSSLVVRGRHDRQVAALSFADHTRVAMVDAIAEVELAIELAERIQELGHLDEE